jgi:hypothetical protein
MFDDLFKIDYQVEQEDDGEIEPLKDESEVTCSCEGTCNGDEDDCRCGGNCGGC